MLTAEERNELCLKTERLAREIWGSLFPHADRVKDPERGWGLPNEVRPRRAVIDPQPGQDADSIQVGDVVAIVHHTVNRHSGSIFNGLISLRQVANGQMNTRPWLVVKRTLKTMTIAPLRLPGGPWNADLSDPRLKTDYTEKMAAGCTSTRDVTVLGKYEDLIARMAAHPRFPEWQQAYKAAKEAAEAHDAAERAAYEQRQKDEEPLRQAAEAINDAMGEKVIDVWLGEARPWGDLSKLPRERMEEIIAGRRILGKITPEQMTKALGALDLVTF